MRHRSGWGCPEHDVLLEKTVFPLGDGLMEEDPVLVGLELTSPNHPMISQVSSQKLQCLRDRLDSVVLLIQ